MSPKQAVIKCAYCKDEIVGEPVKKGDRLYCCQACAFEAARLRRCDPDRLLYGHDESC